MNIQLFKKPGFLKSWSGVINARCFLHLQGPCARRVSGVGAWLGTGAAQTPPIPLCEEENILNIVSICFQFRLDMVYPCASLCNTDHVAADQTSLCLLKMLLFVLFLLCRPVEIKKSKFYTFSLHKKIVCFALFKFIVITLKVKIISQIYCHIVTLFNPVLKNPEMFLY